MLISLLSKIDSGVFFFFFFPLFYPSPSFPILSIYVFLATLFHLISQIKIVKTKI